MPFDRRGFMIAGLVLSFYLVASMAVGADGKAAAGRKKTAEVGGVVVSVTLLPPGAASPATIDFELVMNTHSGALPTNMLKAAKLLEEQGAEVPPLAWSGGGGGHHLSGRLSFPAAGASAGGTYTLLLQGIGGRNDLRFEWTTMGGV